MNVYNEAVLLTNEIFDLLHKKHSISIEVLSDEEHTKELQTKTGHDVNVTNITSSVMDTEYIEKSTEFEEIRKKLLIFITTNFPETQKECMDIASEAKRRIHAYEYKRMRIRAESYIAEMNK